MWMLLAGRGFGKTRCGAEDVAHFGLTNPGVRVAVVAPTYADCRDTCVEGESGLLACIPPEYTENGRTWNRSLGELTLTNGTIYKLYSSEKPDRLRGPQHHRAWLDEVGSWENATMTFDMLQMGLRLGAHPQNVVTTTPKPVKIIRQLVQHPGTIVTRGSTYDNKDNLPETFIKAILAKYEGTRLGRQELYAELLEDYEGALWQRHCIEEHRIIDETPAQVAKRCSRIVVGIDPAVTSGEDSDETGILVCGFEKSSERGYVLADLSCRTTPREWASIAINAYREFDADRIVGEVNNGGDLVESTIRMVDDAIPFKAVRASRGKYVRAEPISALYEQGRIFHVGGKFEDLEDQMCTFTADNIADNSPDRADAMVWAFSELFEGNMNLGALSFMKAEMVAKAEAHIGKLAVSSITKPAVGKQTARCPECQSFAIVRVAGQQHCNQCGATFGSLDYLQLPAKRSEIKWDVLTRVH